MLELTDTNSSAIAAEFVAERARHGSPAMGMVMTLIILVDEDSAHDALDNARRASHEHPARVLGVILGSGRGKSQVNAQLGIGDDWGGEVALIRLSGEVTKHADSVIVPLLLPDSPVVVWWPHDHPADPASDPVGLLAQRRITDAASVHTGKGNAVQRLCAAYAPGTTDLAWTRLTPWRALLAAALDQQRLKVTAATITGEKVSPSADLLGAWLADRLKVTVTRETSAGPGITSVVLDTKEGPVQVERLDGRLATFRSPGNPDRPVALKRRGIPELLAEELRRLDEDDVYAATARKLVATTTRKATKKAGTKATARKRSKA